MKCPGCGFEMGKWEPGSRIHDEHWECCNVFCPVYFIDARGNTQSSNQGENMKCPRCGCGEMEMISEHGDEVDLWHCLNCYTAWWIDQYHPNYKSVRSYRGLQGSANDV